jgi:ComEC/Rec2-related protein
MMVRWWAAFFALGLIVPQRIETGLFVTAAVAVAILFALLSARGRPPEGRGFGERLARVSASAYVAIACSTAVIVWTAGGIERSVHDLAVMRNERETRLAESQQQRDTYRPQDRTGHRRPAGGGGDGGRIRSRALWDERARLLTLLEDGRLSPRARGIVGALVLNDRSGIDWRLSETYAYLGISHFLALSGLHLGVIAVALVKLFSILIRRKRLRDALVLAVLFLYAALAGFPPSLERALALCAAAFAFRHSSVPTDLVNALTVGAFALAAVDGSVVFDVGFQLSVSAVYAIALIGMPLSRAIGKRLPRGLRGAALKLLLFPALITCSVQFFTLPLVVALFKRSPLVSPVVNVLVSLPFTVLLYAGALYVFAPIAPLRALLSPVVNAICHFLDRCPSAFSRGPHAALYHGDFNTALYLAGVALVALGLRKRCGQRTRVMAAGACCVVLSFLVSSNLTGSAGFHERDGEPTSIHTISPVVGAASVYVPEGGGVLCVGRAFDAKASYRLTRELWGRGIRRIDCVVVSPSSLRRDHGLFYLLKRVRVGELIVSPYLALADDRFRTFAASRGIAVRTVSAGDRIEAGAVCLEIIGPIYPPRVGEAVIGSGASLRYRLCAGDRGSPSSGLPQPGATIDPDRAGDR